MRCIIRDTPDAVGRYSGDYVAARIQAHFASSDRRFVLGCPTGSTPLATYRRLVQLYDEGRLSFRNVVTFNMDEYVGLPRDHPQSYHSFMWRHFFSHIDIQPCNVHILDGTAPDLVAECEAYERAIAEAGGIDLFLAGAGSDGHVAFNEPGSSLASRTRIKTLARDTIAANSRFFDDDPAQVPRMALTVGVQTVLDAREVVVLVVGQHKAEALRRCIEDGVSHMNTVSCVQLHPNPMVVSDEDAASELRVRTYRYFKDIERAQNEVEEMYGLQARAGAGKGASAAVLPRSGSGPLI
ncbi:uncharacterized protein PFL1_06612 [Pseudozyma flocculosa PF-1]|uniref:Glucosamine-6-phosphate deaminase n=2 Tax=Pseudozyma flocculosa TaxID=84751 RepID=A0A5C3F8I5_9BASI|nr:uncharacterized protein PFL1_06612 [Pseudozyma flocculosa PF-1]EPQ25745.1 hypothetical protein PFL1_06612 [Pseudozyma flocculosa PF-1]SPO40560.1 probable glucosamine-6-phosphate isomerase [Pseudozyma flocculosa]